MKRRRGPASGPAGRDPKRDFQRDDGQDELLSALDKARMVFRSGMAEETALLADSLNPEWRGIARKILGIGGAQFDAEDEARIATMRKVIDGEPYAMFALAREMLDGEELEPAMRERAGTLVCIHSIVVLKQHAADPAASREKELMEILEVIGQPIISMLSADLELIARRSPYENVRSAARAVLDQDGS
jgi:hypothetical protein